MMQIVSPDFVALCIKLLLSLVALHGVNELVRAKRFCSYFRVQYFTTKIISAYIVIFSYLNVANCFLIFQGNKVFAFKWESARKLMSNYISSNILEKSFLQRGFCLGELSEAATGVVL